MPLIPLTHFAVIDGYAVTNSEAKQFKHSPTIEKERPELNEETKRLIASYRSDPADANLKALRKQVEIYYDKERVERRSNLF